MLTRLRDNLLSMPSLKPVQQEIETIKTETGKPTFREALLSKEITVVKAPIASSRSEVLKTTMKSAVVLGESRMNLREAIVDTFNDQTGIDAERSSNYTWDSNQKAFKMA